MNIVEWLKANNKKQGDLAHIIKVAAKSRARDIVRAHRIYHGAMPNESEMSAIFLATNGKVTANDFYGLKKNGKS